MWIWIHESWAKISRGRYHVIYIGNGKKNVEKKGEFRRKSGRKNSKPWVLSGKFFWTINKLKCSFPCLYFITSLSLLKAIFSFVCLIFFVLLLIFGLFAPKTQPYFSFLLRDNQNKRKNHVQPSVFLVPADNIGRKIRSKNLMIFSTSPPNKKSNFFSVVLLRFSYSILYLYSAITSLQFDLNFKRFICTMHCTPPPRTHTKLSDKFKLY